MFGTFSLSQIASALQISTTDVRRMISGGQFPQPDAGVQNWEWEPATVATAFESLTQAGVGAFLTRAIGPLPDGTAAIKPWMQGVAGFN